MILTVDIEFPEDDIPLPSLEYIGEPTTATLASDSESAFSDRRSTREKVYATINVQWVLNPAQFDAFKTFFVETLGNGAAKFSIPLRYPKNSELVGWIVRFYEGFESAYLDRLRQVSAKLELISETLISET